MGFSTRIIFALCAVLLSGCLQLNGISGQAHTPATIIRNIDVTGSGDDLKVEIRATVPITPITQVVSNPDRLIVDFQGALPGAGLHKVIVNRGNLTDVRVGLLSANPRVTRVVLDLTSPTEFRVDTSGSTIFVKLGGESAGGTAPAAVPATTKPPAETEHANSPAVPANPLPERSPERSRAHWILPILTIASVLALLVIAVVSHLQNRAR